MASSEKEPEFEVTQGIVYYKPSYIEFLTQSIPALYKAWSEDESDWVRIQYDFTHFRPIYVVLVVLCGIFWTLLRTYSSKHIFQPFVEKANLDPKLKKKFTELCFNMTVGLVAWLYMAYLTLYKYNLFNEPTKIIYGWDNNQVADYHQSIVYLYQAGFYIHRTYASWYEDEWRKDSPVLMAHHIFTFMLLSTGYIYRYYYCGIFVLFLHDLNDVLLSLSKIFNYLTNEKGNNNTWAYLSRITFGIFIILWYLFRLHWFPLLLLHTTINLARTIYKNRAPPMFFFNNTLLMFLFFMHIYWFKFIISAAFKIITNAKGPIKDDRDIDQKEDNKEK